MIGNVINRKDRQLNIDRKIHNIFYLFKFKKNSK